MASLCLVFCAGDRSLPFGSDHRQWWVCGAHGAWIPSSPLPDCAGMTVFKAKNRVYMDLWFIYLK